MEFALSALANKCLKGVESLIFLNVSRSMVFKLEGLEGLECQIILTFIQSALPVG